jgi:hypothetical protein
MMKEKKKKKENPLISILNPLDQIKVSLKVKLNLLSQGFEAERKIECWEGWKSR